MKIADVRCFQVSGPADLPLIEERVARLLDIYPEFAAEQAVARQAGPLLTQTFVEIEADDGAVGLFGPLFEETALLVLRKLKQYLIGQDPLAGERVWDILYRSDRHARKGYEMMAISAVDCALWDLRGKLLSQPVYRLLGGPTRERVECYASMLGHSHDPDRVRERAQTVVEQGFKAQKWFFRYGPSAGLEGMERNVALVRAVREAVGPHVEILLDCGRGWDASYTIRVLGQIAEYRPRWLEEPVSPDRIDDLALIRRSTRVPIAHGEHEYTRWGFLQLFQAETVDVIQADPDWCGGISELVKICALASAFGRQVIPHGHSIHAAMHVIAAQSPETCPLAEFLLKTQPMKQWFHKGCLEPERGALSLPSTPGLGIEIDEAKVERRVELR